MRCFPLFFVVWLGLSGCHIDDDTLVINRPGLARAAAAAQHRMHARFAAASRIQEAIAFSDLERARAEAHDIAALDESEVSLTWQPYFARAELFGTLLTTCTHCHAVLRDR